MTNPPAGPAAGGGPGNMVERALELARCDDCVVIAEESSNANLRFAGNTLTTNGVARSRRMTVIAIQDRAEGRAAGVVSRSGVGPDQLEDLVRAAEAAAAQAPVAEDGRPLVTGEQAPAGSSGWDEPPAETGIGVFEGLAPALGGAFERAQATGRLLYGFAEHQMDSCYLGTSTGLRLRHDQPTGRLELNAKSADRARSAWAGVATRDFTDVDVAAVDSDLARRLDWAKVSVDLPAGRYETLLPPTAVADLLIYLYWSAGARDAHEGRTVFSKPGGGTRVGERLAEVPLSLGSDPGTPGLECAPFLIARASQRTSSVFDNGLRLDPTAWIRDGELAALIQTRHSAELTGLPATASVDNLSLAGPPTTATVEQMVGRVRRGLLVTCLWYIREVDPQTLLLTGLTRDGVYLVEDGEVVGAVNNFRFNESPVGMLGRVVEAGATEPTLSREWNDYFTRTAMPALRVADFNMSSVSQAS